MTDNKHVVVITDDRGTLELIREILALDAYQVRGCEQIDQAYMVIREAAPDLVILDVRMRGAPDWTVLDLMKSDPATADVPVLLCSAWVRGWEANEARLRARGCDVLDMPFEIDDLLEKARVLVG